jgi:hypothetical protein
MKADDGTSEARAHLDGLPEPRRTHMRHLHDVIVSAIPDADVAMWDYGGPLIGYGSYDYTNSAGKATGRWFSVGLASRKHYISLFSMGQRDGGYLVEAVSDRFPGASMGRSCLNISKPELVDDEAVRDLARETWEQYRQGFRRPERGTSRR